MRFIFEENQGLNSLQEQLLSAIEVLIAGCQAERAHVIIPAGTDVSSFANGSGLYVLREGLLTVSLNDRELFVYEQGDAIFVHNNITEFKIQSDFAVICDFYSANQVSQRPLTSSHLLRVVALQQAFLIQLVSLLYKGERTANPQIRRVKAGETIISEGEMSDQVFTLLEGHAQVLAGGKVVGEVNVDELVGVIGALCDIPRIATVKATTNSMLMSLGKDEFIDLLSLRPHTVVKLIKDFARVISSSNQELLALKSGE